ncbi:hypothetical protein NDU88_008256 [Pleurodeles waltl]|uniref:Uncharacterized protein n=1 Tax=Pleurodeles waltl TaxID=8319 RepID=A0AAV7N4F7_PLEWA|nr:hypothetical protein NDU88_008256 [Pleurodeles waltl]
MLQRMDEDSEVQVEAGGYEELLTNKRQGNKKDAGANQGCPKLDTKHTIQRKAPHSFYPMRIGASTAEGEGSQQSVLFISGNALSVSCLDIVQKQ